MLDSILHRSFASTLEPVSTKLSQAGMGAIKTTIIAFVIGIVGCVAVGFAHYIPGLVLLVASRLLAATTPSMASDAGDRPRHNAITLLFDFTLFGAFVFFFLMGTGTGHGLAATLVTFSFMTMSLSYAAHYLVAAEKNMEHDVKGGLIGQTEMTIFITMACLYPPGFSFFAGFFALLCFITAILRAVKAFRILA